MLIEMMSFVGYRWYPEYIVEEQFCDLNQTQYHCIVRIYPHHIGVTHHVLFGHGIGMTENMAVQDVAYSCMTLLREEHAMLRRLTTLLTSFLVRSQSIMFLPLFFSIQEHLIHSCRKAMHFVMIYPLLNCPPQ